MVTKKEIKYLSSLKQKKNRLLNNEFLIEGSKLILDAFKHKQNIKKIIYSNKDSDFTQIRNYAKKYNVDMELCNQKDSERISDTKNSQQIFALLNFKAPIKITDDTTIDDNIIIIDGVSDPGNLGTILRTCSWFGFYNIILTHNSVELFNPKTIRSAMGAHFHIKNTYKDNIDNIIHFLKKNNYEIIAADLNGKPLKKYSQKSKNWALILGNEAHGISKKSIDSANTIINIEGKKTMESLNVAEAASIIMYHLYQGIKV
tara:strand:- start:13871 stop:14647 length:777 start_codon:yes stop_codon:yes gene_type:complete